MGAKIQADEISSIIKQRIDNFELNVDIREKVLDNIPNKTLKYYSNYHKRCKKKIK